MNIMEISWTIGLILGYTKVINVSYALNYTLSYLIFQYAIKKFKEICC